jgi:hypothetical protein
VSFFKLEVLSRIRPLPNSHIVLVLGYIYRKDMEKFNITGIPHLKDVLWENPGGHLTVEPIGGSRGGIADVFAKKPKRRAFDLIDPMARLIHSGDGSVPYLSLSWAHTWLLHAARARHNTENKSRQDIATQTNVSTEKNALDYIHVSHRPRGKMDWVDGPPLAEEECVDKSSKIIDDSGTGTSHPHGTKYSEKFCDIREFVLL